MVCFITFFFLSFLFLFAALVFNVNLALAIFLLILVGFCDTCYILVFDSVCSFNKAASEFAVCLRCVSVRSLIL